jgi:hypothetical protein
MRRHRKNKTGDDAVLRHVLIHQALIQQALIQRAQDQGIKAVKAPAPAETIMINIEL